MQEKIEQYYPTYKFDKESRDVLLIEFDEAQKIANSQTKVYGQVANILIAVITILIPLFITAEESTTNKVLIVLKTHNFLFACILVFFGGIILRYFVDLQKQITINARKAVTLRRLLGVDYGSINLTLPNWRVEGATNPFCIKYFKGWFKFESTPFWVLLIGINTIWYITNKNLTIPIFLNYGIVITWQIGSILIFLLYYYLFRMNLYGLNETLYFNIVKGIASLIGLKIIDDIEYIIYRAKLSYIELDRLKLKYENLKKILVDIEDKTFYDNNGVSFKSMVRALISRSKYLRTKNNLIESGGSTLTMQLSRTLFIEYSKSKFRRKIIEILLAPWITNQFKKDEILKMYIASVRYEKGIYGLAAGKKHFFRFKFTDKEISNEEALFFVERLSNITSSYKVDRIKNIVSRTDVEINQDELFKIYDRLKTTKQLKEVN